jgi:hypothetical protein
VVEHEVKVTAVGETVDPVTLATTVLAAWVANPVRSTLPPGSVTVPVALRLVKLPAAATVPPIAGGLAKYVLNPVPLIVLLAERVVKAPVLGEVAPIVVASMAPPPIIAEGVLTEENAPVLVETDPMGPGDEKVAPPRVKALILPLQLNPEPLV